MITFLKKETHSLEIPVKVNELTLVSDSENQESVYFCVSSAGPAGQNPMYVPRTTLRLMHVEKMQCLLEQVDERERSFWRLSLHLMDGESKLIPGQSHKITFNCPPAEVDFDNYLVYGNETVNVQADGKEIAVRNNMHTPAVVDETYVEYTRRERIEKKQVLGSVVAHVANLSFADTASQENLAGITKAVTLDFIIDGGRQSRQYAEQLIHLFTDTETERVRMEYEEYLSRL